MIKAGYEQLKDRISKSSGLSGEEVERRIDAKIAKLSGLISKEGAAQIVAAELGVNFDKQKVKLSELLSGMRKVSVTGKITDIFPVRTYTRGKNEGKVANFIIADDTASVRAVLWDNSHITMIESGKLNRGSVVEIKDASVRDGELHLGSTSKLEESNETMENVSLSVGVASKERNIADLQDNDRAMLRAAVVQIFEPRFFYVCPECSLRVDRDGEKFTCKTHGIVIPQNRAVLTLVIDDGTDNIMAVCFKEAIDSLMSIQDTSQLQNLDFLIAKRQELLGKEFWFSGNCRKNKIFGNTEFMVSSAREVSPREIIEKLER